MMAAVPRGQDARQIFGDAAAGNVSQRGNALRVDQLLSAPASNFCGYASTHCRLYS